VIFSVSWWIIAPRNEISSFLSSKILKKIFLLHGLGNIARHIPCPFVEQGVVLHYQEVVVVLLQDGPKLGRR
jgi:urease accessory protein UreE